LRVLGGIRKSPLTGGAEALTVTTEGSDGTAARQEIEARPGYLSPRLVLLFDIDG